MLAVKPYAKIVQMSEMTKRIRSFLNYQKKHALF